MALLSDAMLVLVGALVREISDQIGLFQVLLTWQIIFLLILIPAMKTLGSSLFKPQGLRLHGLRVLGAFLYLYFGFVAVSNLPLADATALGFTSVLFVALIAKLWLAEALGWQRTLTIIIGFGGILLITQPGFGDQSGLYIAAGLLAALGGAIAATCVRKLSQTQPKTLLLVYQAFAVGLMALVPALNEWQWPDSSQVGQLLLIGVLSSLETSMGVNAYQKAPANVASNLGYSQMVFALMLGYWLFIELLNRLALIGVAFLLASALLPLCWRRGKGS